jgi:hypothetical protein
MSPKKGTTTNFFSPLSFIAVFGSGVRDPGWVKIRIRDKHSGSATLVLDFSVLYSALLHLSPLRIDYVGGFWDQTKDSCDFSIGYQTL